MPFHKIGEHYPAAPLTFNDKRVSDQEVERWFKEAFLPLQNNPYIDFEANNAEHVGYFFHLAAGASDTGSELSSTAQPGVIRFDENTSIEQKRTLFEASQDGNLFYYDKGLGERGGMHQLYTRTVMVGGTQDFELCMTDAITELPAPVKPQGPSFWKYLLYPFFSKEIQAYNAEVKKYTTLNTATKALAEKIPAHVNHMGGLSDKTFQDAQAARTQRIQKYEYEQAMQTINPQPKKESAYVQRPVGEFVQYLNNISRQDIYSIDRDVMSKWGATVEDHYTAMAQMLEVQLAQRVLQEANSLPGNAGLEFLNRYQKPYQSLAHGLKDFVRSHISEDLLQNVIDGPLAKTDRSQELAVLKNELMNNGLVKYQMKWQVDNQPKQQMRQPVQQQMRMQQPQVRAPQQKGGRQV